MNKSSIDISVAVPTYNSADTLIKLLTSLELSSFSKDKFEVVICDDGSTDDTAEKVYEYMKKSRLQVNYFVRERTKLYGCGIARNEAILRSKGRVIAFTDADCVVDPDWLSVIWHHLKQEKFAAIAGEIYCDEILVFPWKDAPVREGVVATANFAYDRGKVGEHLNSEEFIGLFGEDVDLFMRLKQRGFEIASVPDMKVLHPAKRYDIKRFINRVLSRENEVLLHKKYGASILHVMHPVFRPYILGRLSLVACFFAVVCLLLVLPILFASLSLFIGVVTLFTFGVLSFCLYFYRYCVFFTPPGEEIRISWHERLKTLAFLGLYMPLFVYARLAGTVKFRHLLL